MPGLISSAAPGKKAAPKAPARRRPAAPTGTSSSARLPTPSSAANSVAPPSPPPTQTPTQVPTSDPVVEDLAVQLGITPAQQPSEHPFEQEQRERETEHRPGPENILVFEKQPESTSAPESVHTAIVTQVPAPPSPEPTQPDEQPSNGFPGIAGELQSSSGAQQPSQDGAQSISVDGGQAQVPEPASVPTPEQTQRSSRVDTTATANPKLGAKRTRAEPSGTLAVPPVKKVKRTSTRSNAAAAAIANGKNVPSSSVEESEQTAAQAQTLTRRRQPARKSKRIANFISAERIVVSDDETAGAENPDRAQEAELVTDVGAEAETESAGPSKPKSRRKKAKRKKNIEGEEQEGDDGDESDPEAHEINPKELSMWDLSYDTRHGKMSERGKKMAEINWEEVAEKRRAEANAIANGGQQPAADVPQTAAAPEGVVPTVEGPNGTTESMTEGVEDEENTAGKMNPAQSQFQPISAPEKTGPQDGGLGLQLDADGNIILDDATTHINRDADAVAAAATDKPIEEINDLTTQVNRTTWINQNRRDPTDRVPNWKWKSDPWSEEETDRFYDALCMFGTDFMMISKMFVPKTRRMIKAKFNREERIDPQRVNDALVGKLRTTMDLDHYAQQTSRDVSVYQKYDSIEHAQNIINETMKERQDAMTTAAQKDAQRETEKREQEKQKKAEKSKAPRKSKKSKSHGTFGGGGPDDGA